jgi:Ran GTPase-activating protein (RanGAP) involved in mRNA processing and transport
MHLADKDVVPMAAALENNGSLRSLDLSNNDLGEKAAVALGNMLAVRLRRSLWSACLRWA